ncbi:MAG TPA: hypothetical protein VFC38_08710 [Stellaceae bacterium]|nr:hypothetical protein [Stellaceae bacterium]
MKAALISVLVALGLAGCATPITILKNPTTGETVRCGGGTAGSAAGGMLGYSIEQSHDAECVRNYRANGFEPVVINGIEVNGGPSKSN